ncbi:MAG: hypothetical protein EOP48_26835 [Sphingobacteriales bacterium]|nr:MAG: hypothetical protein EOP48_26835 [Sphingobacteriales bacterium]
MSTRSPKDTWIKVDESLGISPDDSSTTKIDKIQRQLNLCKVDNVHQVMMLINNSERLQSDIDLHIEKADHNHHMSLVFVTWVDIPIEKQIRVFVKLRVVIAFCPYFGDLLSDTQTNHLITVTEKQIRDLIESMSAQFFEPSKH